MKISGFSFVRNAIKLFYPVAESIQSTLPLVDEFVIACGDSEDGTTDLVRSISDPKIKIIETVWDKSLFVRGASNSHQSNIALDACTGNWCVYLQADEVLHEKDLPGLREKMEEYLDEPSVEGLLFDYIHFYGDYDHYQMAHNWYRREVRVIRNGIGVRSHGSAQSFRRNGEKLKVVHSGGTVYHYGWVRPPVKMMRKQIALSSVHHDEDWVREHYPDEDKPFDFGSLKTVNRFEGEHPAVMKNLIASIDWSVKPGPPNKHEHKHDRLWERLLTFVENNILGGTKIGEYRAYKLIRPLRTKIQK